MAGRFGTWFDRRVVRADVRGTDIVSSTGVSVLRYGQYLEEGRGGRWFWLLASAAQLLLFVALPFTLVWGLWERSDLDRGDPARIGLGLLVTAASWWTALIWQGSVRGMARALSAPRREWEPFEDEDDEDG